MIRSLFSDAVVTWEALAADWTGVLLAAEAEQIRDAGAKRRREFTAGRVCARAALARLGIEDFPLLSDPDRVPRWPPGIVGSLSHTGSWCGVAVARAEVALGLGLDVERGGPLGARLATRVCTPRELERFARLPGLAGADWPKLAFSAKEAVFKSYYPLARHRLGFQAVELEIDPQARTFQAALTRADAPSVAGHRCFQGRFAVVDGYVCAGVQLG